MIPAVVGTLLLAVLLVGQATVLALRAEHLIALYWSEAGLFLFTRAEGGRYDRVPLWKVPLAVTAFAAGRLHERARHRALAPAPTGKVQGRFAH